MILNIMISVLKQHDSSTLKQHDSSTLKQHDKILYLDRGAADPGSSAGSSSA